MVPQAPTLLIGLLLAGTGMAASEIRLCEGSSGEAVFTDRGNCPVIELVDTLTIVEVPVYVGRREGHADRAGRRRTRGGGKDRTARRDIPRECRWEWGRARDIEGLLGRARSPSESRWLPNYCRWQCEIRQAGCDPLPGDFEHLSLCTDQGSDCRALR